MNRIDDVIAEARANRVRPEHQWAARLASLAHQARRPDSVLDRPELMQPGSAARARNGFRSSDQGFNYGEYA